MEQTPQVPRYWFPAKRYGWGWGPPNVWQGWLVLAAYPVALLILAFTVRLDVHPLACALGLAGLSALLLTVCWLKGEPPRWRWGK